MQTAIDQERWSTRRTARELGDKSEVAVRALDHILRPERAANGRRHYVPSVVRAYLASRGAP